MTIIFRAKTKDNAYVTKILSELLEKITKITSFNLTPEGINIRLMNSNENMLLDISLDYKNFDVYECIPKELDIGINLANFYRMMKSLKKKDTLQLSIDDELPDELIITVIPQDNNRVSTSSVYIQNLQNIFIELPEGYNKPILIHSNEFQRTLKDLINMNNTLKISLKSNSLFFECVTNNIYSRKVQFGEVDDNSEIYYEETFDIDYFSRILKIASLGKQIWIYGAKGLPLLIESHVGNLGKISVYIKSHSMCE
jgi:proliferating cell nuclear antigen PCNA